MLNAVNSIVTSPDSFPLSARVILKEVKKIQYLNITESNVRRFSFLTINC